MTDKLTISDLAEVLIAIKEISKPYQLGIQLKVDLAELDSIERNHHGDIGRQKTEVVKYWLLNSPDASWATLANAMKEMGGYARLTKTLSIMGGTANLQEEEEQIYENPVLLKPVRQIRITKSRGRSLDMCVPRTILLFGKRGHGKSTLGNRMLNSDGWFKINDQRCPQTTQGSSMISSVSQLKDYKIEVFDHSGLFEGASSIDELSSAVSKELNLVVFVLKHGYNFDESEVAILKSVMGEWRISRVSALILTHCERLSEEERGEMIEQFKKDHPSITELMGKGILAVGFPDSSHIQPGSPLSQRVEEDEASLRQLIYSCNELKFIPQKINRRPYQSEKEPPPQNEKEQPPQNEKEQLPQNKKEQPHLNENRRRLCCSIL